MNPSSRTPCWRNSSRRRRRRSLSSWLQICGLWTVCNSVQEKEEEQADEEAHGMMIKGRSGTLSDIFSLIGSIGVAWTVNCAVSRGGFALLKHAKIEFRADGIVAWFEFWVTSIFEFKWIHQTYPFGKRKIRIFDLRWTLQETEFFDLYEKRFHKTNYVILLSGLI